MTMEERGLVDLERREGSEDKGVRKIPVFRKEPSFSRWHNEVGIDSSNNRSKSGGDGGEFELPILQIDGSENGVLDRERSSSIEIDHLLNRTNSFRHRSIHLYDGDVGNDSPRSREDTAGNGEDIGTPRDREDAAGNGEKISSFVVEHENDSMPGNPSLWVATPKDRSFHEFKTEDNDLKCLNESKPKNQSSISAAVLLKTLFFILVWYTSSTCLTLYNKSLLGDHLGKFPAPLLMNTVHFTMQAVLSKAILWLWSQRFEPSEVMSWRNYFVKVVPTALGTALDINLSNASLVFISVTFATMCKSASPVFLLLFAFAFKLEAPSLKLLGIIFIISIGVLLTVAKETEFEFWGFLFVMLASVMSGFRWSMTQILLQRETYATSAVTVTIAGVVKEAVTIVVAVFYFHDEFTLLKGLGLFIIMVGVSLFNWYKYERLHKGHLGEKGESIGLPHDSATAKYVILDNMDEMDEEA